MNIRLYEEEKRVKNTPKRHYHKNKTNNSNLQYFQGQQNKHEKVDDLLHRWR